MWTSQSNDVIKIDLFGNCFRVIEYALMYRLLIYRYNPPRYRRKQGGIVHCMRVALFVVCDSVPSVCKLFSAVLFTFSMALSINLWLP